MKSPAERSRAYRDRKRGAAPRQHEPCGSVAAARRHQRNGEPPCALCAPVWADHQAAMYQQRRSAPGDLQLLAEAADVLDQYRYTSDGQDELNNDDVMDIIDRIRARLGVR